MSILFHFFTYSLSVFILSASLLAAPAQAEVFVWQDEATKVSWSFPDRWAMGNDQKPSDVVTILAPGEDQATCRMRTQEDRRFVIYPRRLDDRVQRLNVSREFWDAYTGQFDNAVINDVRDDAGLGLAFASVADVSYVTEVGPRVQKRALMLAGIYNDTAYVFECSAAFSKFEQWRDAFGSVLHSVDMRLIRHPYTPGYYRDFMGDPDLLIHNSRPEDLYVF